MRRAHDLAEPGSRMGLPLATDVTVAVTSPILMSTDGFQRWCRIIALLLGGLSGGFPVSAGPGNPALPDALRVVLAETRPLEHARGPRLPLLILPISHTLRGVPQVQTEEALKELNLRGIGYSVSWSPADPDASIAEALRIARCQRKLGMHVIADATACLHSFFDGADALLHVDDSGAVFAETSFGGKLGCPFTLEPRVPVIRERIDRFVRAYRDAGLPLDLVFADWEIDGPIEWNDAWANSKRCRRCRDNVVALSDFRAFQRRLREIRSALQRRAFSEPVLAQFPRALVGNYGVYPNDGYRYWYDYFEREGPPGAPVRMDHHARYREWVQEFGPCGYTLAMPVIYTWYPTFHWYDFSTGDYRWIYNLLLNASNAGRHTPSQVPILPFVHWTTTAPPPNPDPAVRQLDARAYQELLWHLLLRGHDTFFLWCLPEELRSEVRLLHPVYAESLAHREFLDHGVPITFEVPTIPGSVVSGLRWKDQVLVRRTDFSGTTSDLDFALPEGGRVRVSAVGGLQVLPVASTRPAVVLPDGLRQ
ncbi:MAG: hypothetical protein JNK85_01880 [Verrucomicrobiales bacterium]|nr:hypothetical protein [Verrucomicrobiales bacterium]